MRFFIEEGTRQAKQETNQRQKHINPRQTTQARSAKPAYTHQNMHIATHDGPFHADETLAIATLKLLHPDCTITRTRNPAVYNQANVRIDVGGAYNPQTGDFDHHQRGGAGARTNGIPYASAGLIWKHFGHQLTTKEEHERVDLRLFCPIDAGDNGVSLCQPTRQDILPYELFKAIETLVPPWTTSTPEQLDAAFHQAVFFMQTLLKAELAHAKSYIASRAIVLTALKNQPGPILVLPEPCEWEDWVIQHPEKLFVIKPNKDKTAWFIRAVPKKQYCFENRKDFPLSWAGLSGKALEKASGVKGATFCHNNRFLAVATTKEAARQLAEKALHN
ncbi:MYG1 family protein [Candidatus Woesearchaeota archaeon]|nr:MAG: MYG1 family protein [Candidatus Woesearchaeota archaeon]